MARFDPWAEVERELNLKGFDPWAEAERELGKLEKKAGPGFLSSLSKQGLPNLGLAVEGLLYQSGVESPEAMAQAARQGVARQGERPDYAQRFTQKIEQIPEGAGFLESAKGITGAIAEEPKGAAYTLVEQIPYSLPSLAGAFAGARIGSTFGLHGAVIGGLVGMGGGSFLTEKGANVIETLAELEPDPDNWENFLQSPEGQAAVQQRGTMKGVGVAPWDIAGALLQLGIFRRAINAAGVKSFKQLPAASQLKTVALGLGTEAVTEGAGEYTGEYLSTGKGDMKEALLESAMALGPGSVELVGPTYLAGKSAFTQPQLLPEQPQPRPEPPMPPEQPPKPEQPPQPPQPEQPPPQPPPQPEPQFSQSLPQTKITAPLPPEVDPNFDLDSITITQQVQGTPVERKVGSYYQETYDKKERLSAFLKCLGAKSWDDCVGSLPLDDQKELVANAKDSMELFGDKAAPKGEEFEFWLNSAAVAMRNRAESEHSSVRDYIIEAVKAGIIPRLAKDQPDDPMMEQIRKQLTPRAATELGKRRLRYIEKLGKDHIYEQFASIQNYGTNSFSSFFKNRKALRDKSTKGKVFWKLKSDVPLSDVTVHYSSISRAHLRQFDDGSRPRKLLEEIINRGDQGDLYGQFLKEGYRVAPTGYTEETIQYVGSKPLADVVEPAPTRPIEISPESRTEGDPAWHRPRYYGGESDWASEARGKKSTALWGRQISLDKPEDIPRGRTTVAAFDDSNPLVVERMKIATQLLDALVSRMMPDAKIVLTDGQIWPIEKGYGAHFLRYGDIFVIELGRDTLTSENLLLFLALLFHEFGHAYVYYAFNNLTFEQQLEIYKDYRDFLNTMGRSRATEDNARWRFILSRLNHANAEVYAGEVYGDPLSSLHVFYDKDYWYGFDEWIADQISRWGINWVGKARSPASQSFFESVWQALKQALTVVRDFIRKIPGHENISIEEISEKMMPSKAVKKWLDAAYARKAAGIAPLRPAPMAMVTGAAEGAIKLEIEPPIFYGAVKDAAERFPQEKGSGDQWYAWIAKSSKQEERDWLGLKEFLAGKKTWTKEEVLQFIRENEVTLKEVIKDPTIFGEYIGPFSESGQYNELLITLEGTDRPFTESHWQEENVLVHARFDVRSLNKKRTLFVQEIQSDWHQKGKKSGYTEKGKDTAYKLYLEKLLRKAGERKEKLERVTDSILQRYNNVGYPSTAEARYGLYIASDIAYTGEIDQSFYQLLRDVPMGLVSVIEKWVKATWEHSELFDYIASGGAGDLPTLVYRAEGTFPDKIAKKKAAKRILSKVKSDRNGWSNPKPLTLLDLITAGKHWKLVYDLDKVLTPRELEIVEEGVAASRGSTGNKLPDAPFKASSSWSMLAFKRILRWAVDKGFEQVAWTKGATQTERYSGELRRKIGFIEWGAPSEQGYGRPRPVVQRAKWEIHLGDEIWVFVKENGIIIAGFPALRDRLLEDVIGKEIAERIMSSQSGGKIEGEELTIGGEGMKGFYDKILPTEVQKYVKKWGGKVGQGKLAVGEPDVKFAVVSEDTVDVYLGDSLEERDIPEELIHGVFSTYEEAEKHAKRFSSAAPYEVVELLIAKKTEPVWVLPITKEMRDSVSKRPQPLFSEASPPPVALSSFESSEAIRNRTLLDKWHWYTKFGENLLQLFQENLHIPGLGRYVESVMQWSRDKGAIHAQANETVRFIESTLSKDQMQRVGNFLFEYNKLESKPTQDKMIALYQKAGLNEAGIAAATRVINDYLSYLNGLEDALIASIEGNIEDPVRQNEKIAQVKHEMQLLRDRPYVPQTRFTRQNRYTAVVKTKHETVYEGRVFKPGDTVRMEAFYTKGQAAKRAAELRREFGEGFTVAERYIPDELNTFRGIPPAFIDHMKEVLKLSPTQLAILDELKFETSGAQSHKRHFMRRKDIPGYSTDWLRAFAEYFFYGANHLARARWAFELDKAIGEVRTEANIIAQHGGNTVIRDKIWEYLNTHKEYILYPKNEFDSLRAFGFLWYLGLVPRAALVNLGQVPFVAFPWMAARFGDIAATGALIKSFKDVRKLFSQDARGIDPGFKKALKEAVKAGFIDESNAADLAAYADYSAIARAIGGTKLEKTLRVGAYVGAWMFHQAERWNRRHVFKATYDLAIKNLNNPKIANIIEAHAHEIARLKSEGFREAEAKAYVVARAAVLATQYEYAKWNRPLIMRGKRSVVFLFMNYLQNTLWFMRNDPGGLRALVILAAVAGLQGLPGADDLASVLRALYRQWTGKDIDPWREVREFAADLNLNPELVLHGMGRYTLGLANEISGLPIPALDLSGSFSLGRIIPGLSALGPPGDFKDKFMAASTDVGGAFVSIPMAVAQALADDNPDQQKRWERAMPTALKMLSRWERYGMGERVEETQYGADIVRFDPMDPMHNAEVAMTALGFTPTRVSAAWEQSRMEMELARYWVGRRQNLARAYDYALERRDREVMADVQRQIREFNAEAPSPKLRITQDYLKESRKRREKSRREREAGRPRVKGLERESREIRRLFAPPAG